MKRVWVLTTLLAIGFGGAPRIPAAQSAPAHEVVVIVNPANTVNGLDRKSVIQFFLKKKSQWPNGETVLPVDLGADSEVREWFSDQILGRTVSEVKNYWQRNIFSGHKVPPPELGGEADVAAYVHAHPEAIGYVSDPSKAAGNKVLSVQE
jgi:ABC-type phosphate transport system substrate-binding protein